MAKKRQTKSEFRRTNLKDGKNHPTYIYAKVGNEYMYLGITHARITKGIQNIRLEKNPQKGRSDPAYIRDELRRDSKTAFGSRLPEYNLSRKDREMIAEKLLQKRKKK